MYQDRVFCVYYNVSFVAGDVFVGSSEVECSAKEVLADGRVEFFDVKANKTVVLFIFNGFEPFDHRCDIFPLVEFRCSHDLAVDSAVDSVKDFFLSKHH